MTGKQRANIRAKANGLDPIFQLGKGGLNDNLVEQIDGALRTRELIKIRLLLDTCPEEPRAVADEIAARTSAEVIQVIGGVIVLYRYEPELHKKKPKPAKKDESKSWYTVARYPGERTPHVKTAKEHKDQLKRKAAAKRKNEK